jgi:hypothetical protein
LLNENLFFGGQPVQIPIVGKVEGDLGSVVSGTTSIEACQVWTVGNNVPQINFTTRFSPGVHALSASFSDCFNGEPNQQFSAGTLIITAVDTSIPPAGVATVPRSRCVSPSQGTCCHRRFSPTFCARRSGPGSVSGRYLADDCSDSCWP